MSKNAKLKKPIEPQKPIKPIHPEKYSKTKIQEFYLSDLLDDSTLIDVIIRDKTISLSKLKEIFNDKVKDNKAIITSKLNDYSVYVKSYNNCEEENFIDLCLLKEVDKTDQEIEQLEKNYNLELKKYKKLQEIFEEETNKYNLKKDQYDIDIEKYNLEQINLRKAQLQLKINNLSQKITK